MTLQNLRDDVGSKINQIDETSGEFITGFITTAEVDRWINQTFQEVYKWYALANRGRFSTVAHTDTVVDQVIYPLGGDAEDCLAIESVGIKETSEDEYYKIATPARPHQFYIHGAEESSLESPIYFETQIYDEANSEYVLAIEFPEDSAPEEAVTDGLEIRYIERPPVLEETTDEPQKLPLELHKLIVTGASVPALEKMGEYDQAGFLEGKFNSQIKTFFMQEQSVVARGTKTIKPTRAMINKFYRRNR